MRIKSLKRKTRALKALDTVTTGAFDKYVVVPGNKTTVQTDVIPSLADLRGIVWT
jgi:hypothetical protein